MKTWYKAVCDKHKEMIDIFVTDVAITNYYLLERNDVIRKWLSDHYVCALRLIHHDLDLDEVYNNGFKKIR